MAFQPPPSPPLPTFAIKDLCGPANPPALISISKRRYDATIKSTPDATLLYLDDDDGELITVGSSHELSQRLEEPPPRYIHEFRNPADGNMVHVFDINHNTGSLLQWRDHEAYTSKLLQTPQQDRPSLHNYSHDGLRPAATLSPHITYPSLPRSHNETTASQLDEDTDALQPKIEEVKEADTVSMREHPNILDGIEAHLSGLANVLQIAATTLQKAADKTRETDTSVVEDILLGVKGILTQVGSFGVEAFKELGAEISTVANEDHTIDRANTSRRLSVSNEDSMSAQLAREAKEVYESRRNYKEEQLSDDRIKTSGDKTQSSETYSKVRFDLPEHPVRSLAAGSMMPEVRASHDESLNLVHEAQPSSLKDPATGKAYSLSFLEDFSEDADFTARYPPLSTVRRVRSTIEKPSRWPTDDKEKTRPASRYDRAAAAEREAPDGSDSQDLAAQNPFASPFASPTLSKVDTSVCGKDTTSETRSEKTDPVRKPLPGAWPDVKNESMPVLPAATESSGDFFNRMVGRGRPGRYRTPVFQPGLHRSNTTASSNPASRLNGPFDPGFPYDPSPASSHRPNPFRPYRPHRRSASPPRYWLHRHETRQARDDGDRSFLERSAGSPPSIPAKVMDNASQPFVVNSKSKFDSHRAIKHHRSVPQFHSAPSPPSQGSASKPTNTFQPPPRTFTDFLSGPPMPMPPPMPFTTRPPFIPKPAPPNMWAPWQSSPPMQVPSGSTPPSVSERHSQSSNSSAGRNFGSPVSSQSTLGRDFDLPSNEPPFPSAQPQRQPISPPTRSYRPSPATTIPVTPLFFPPPPPLECMQVHQAVDKIDECVEQLKMCGFGVDDDNLKNRLHVYAVAADGDITEAVEMIEQDRKMTAPGRFD